MRRVVSTASTLFVLLLLPPVLAVAAEGTASEPLEPVYFQTIKIDGFWKDQFKRLTERWIPHCIKQMEAGGEGQELLNLVNAAKALKGEPHGEYIGRISLNDAAVYNTIESICLALAVDADGDVDLAKAQGFLRAKLDEWIPIVLAAQWEDGYIDSYHILNKLPRYQNPLSSSQFYVQGYFIEMGVAHYRITGGADRRLYDAARLCADHLCTTFGPPPKRVWIHSHPGMAYALCRLGRLVNEVESPGDGDKYIQLAKFLLDTRHTVEEYRSEYGQSHLPVVEMTEAVGHAVCLTYLCTGVADLAMLTHDEGYRSAVERMWANTVHRKYYLTGGVGTLPSRQGEAFSVDFDLPNESYCACCAGCGMTFWADRMTRMHHDAHHVDVQERTLYNNTLGAIGLSGENYFYQNPLAGFYRNDAQGFLEKTRYSWHECPCCVGNLPRALLGIKDLMYALDAGTNTLYVRHFVASEGTIAEIAGTSLRISQETDYPWSGDVKIVLKPDKPVEFTLKIRIPDRTESDLYTATPELGEKFTVAVNGTAQTLSVKNGFVSLRRRWHTGDVVSLALPMDVQRVHCDARVKANGGRVALIRGPITYNIESVDHDCDINELILPTDMPLNAVWRPELLGGVMAIEGRGATGSDDGRKPTKVFAVPNYVRLNRGGRSQVWITEDPEKTMIVETQSK